MIKSAINLLENTILWGAMIVLSIAFLVMYKFDKGKFN